MSKELEFMQNFAQERGVGTESNNQLIDMLEMQLTKMGYSIHSLPFPCMVWEQGPSALTVSGLKIRIEPNPFSEPFQGMRRICAAAKEEELQGIDCKDAILFLFGELTQNPISPKDYPFYYPEEDKKLIDLLEEKQPAAIIAVTGKTAMHGKNPFPFFEDGNFLIPSASISSSDFQRLSHFFEDIDTTGELIIDSHKRPEQSRQIVASKKAAVPKGKIILAAHMDSKYNTPGALDNAAGVAVLLEIAEKITIPDYDIDIVPFNSEEYYGAAGELEYLKHLDENVSLMVNIDSPCFKGSKTGVSFYNFDHLEQAAEDVMRRHPLIVKGSQWYAGDHSPFLFRGIPCLAMISADFSSGALEYTHTPEDTLETVDVNLIQPSAQYLIELLQEIFVEG